MTPVPPLAVRSEVRGRCLHRPGLSELPVLAAGGLDHGPEPGPVLDELVLVLLGHLGEVGLQLGELGVDPVALLRRGVRRKSQVLLGEVLGLLDRAFYVCTLMRESKNADLS